MICFDDIDRWAPKLSRVLLPLAPRDIQRKLQLAAPEYIEDARDLFLELVARDSVIDAMLGWLQKTRVAGYHGTRLTDTDVESIKSIGLVALRATARRARLERALSRHPRWNKVAARLDEAIHSVGPGGAVGRREGQVHLTLSRAGLTNGFNHYLTHGAEFDWHVASILLGDEGRELLSTDGIPHVIQLAVPGESALTAAHPFFSVEDMRARGELPNIIKEFLAVWCFRLARPRYQSRTLKIDCGMIFNSTVPAEWIRRMESWASE
jgi:hypothetical protein